MGLKPQRVFVAMSGGVDSSVAAALLKERGFDVVGIHMKMWNPADSYKLQTTSYQQDAVCRQQYQDRIDAIRVASALDIPFQTWDFSKEYRRAVVEYMLREYAAGRTPNPDVMCNREIKFGLFLQRALKEGADYIATGHYVRKLEVKSKKLEVKSYALAQARDLNKDQTYFLWTLAQKQLRHCLFPIGEYTKSEVREMARKFGLLTAGKPDSQGLCFVGEINVGQFLRDHIPAERGLVLTAGGRAVGKHDGLAFYTIGQRQGLGIGGGIPYYVATKQSQHNTLIVAEGPYDGALFRDKLIAVNASWISGEAPRLPLRCLARIRYRQPLQRCTVARIKKQPPSPELQVEGESRSKVANALPDASYSMLRVVFDEPQRAVTPGQSVVFYRSGSFDLTQDREMLGGGVIA